MYKYNLTFGVVVVSPQCFFFSYVFLSPTRPTFILLICESKWRLNKFSTNQKCQTQRLLKAPTLQSLLSLFENMHGFSYLSTEGRAVILIVLGPVITNHTCLSTASWHNTVQRRVMFMVDTLCVQRIEEYTESLAFQSKIFTEVNAKPVF